MGSDVQLDTVLLPSNSIVIREIAGETLIMPLASRVGNSNEDLYVLNDTGKEILRHLDGNSTIGQIINLLSDEYLQTADQIQRDVLEFCQTLLDCNILSIKR